MLVVLGADERLDREESALEPEKVDENGEEFTTVDAEELRGVAKDDVGDVDEKKRGFVQG